MILRVIYTLLLFFSTLVGFSQTKDASVWIGNSFEVDINKKIAATITEEIRFDENISELGTFFTDIGLEGKLSKKMSLGVNYRNIRRRRLDDSYALRHRFYADVNIRQKTERITFTYRLRYEMQYSNIAAADFGSSGDGFTARNRIRNRVGVRLNTEKKVKPYFTIELFNYPKTYQFDMRYNAGIDYKMSKKYALTFFYQLNNEFGVNNPQSDYTIGVGQKFSL
ncbi:MAG: DUF2490 domain-containing protein [Bacteroidetes bacterium]|nr:DUF2490 domain-containing protein [Bacteroidota bacterium]